MGQMLLALGIHILEFLFIAGAIGCAVVVVLVAIDDVREVTQHEPANHARSAAAQQYPHTTAGAQPK